jgi:hypothetical protein
MRAVLNTLLLSVMPVRPTRSASARIFCTPATSRSGKRNTPQCACIVRRISLPTSKTLSPFFCPSSRARRAIVRSAASAGSVL